MAVRPNREWLRRSLAITSQGVTVHIGDEIDAGIQNGLSFPEFRGRLREECEGADLMDLTNRSLIAGGDSLPGGR